jgi:hypothetical protein
MRLNKIAILPFLFALFMLASCPNNQSNQSASISKNDSIYQGTYYSLTVTGKTELLIVEPFQPSTDMEITSYSYRPNDWVVFGVGKVMDADVVVKLNGEKLESHQESSEIYYYQFYMPARDSVIDISIEGGI